MSIVRIDREPVLRPNDVFDQLRKLRPQAQLVLTVVRQGRVLELPVRLGARAIGSPPDFDLAIDAERRELPSFELVDRRGLAVCGQATRWPRARRTGESRTPTRPPTVLIEGAGMTIRLEGDPANRQATITDSHGSILYQGGITTPSDRSQMPRHVWARVAELMDPSDLSPRIGPQLESDELWERPGLAGVAVARTRPRGFDGRWAGFRSALLQRRGRDGFTAALRGQVRFLVRAVKRHLRVEPEVENAQHGIGQPDVPAMFVASEDGGERTRIGAELTGARDGIIGRPAQIRSQTVVSLAEVPGGFTRQQQRAPVRAG